jgi:hypothetical protein
MICYSSRVKDGLTVEESRIITLLVIAVSHILFHIPFTRTNQYNLIFPRTPDVFVLTTIACAEASSRLRTGLQFDIFDFD